MKIAFNVVGNELTPLTVIDQNEELAISNYYLQASVLEASALESFYPVPQQPYQE